MIPPTYLLSAALGMIVLVSAIVTAQTLRLRPFSGRHSFVWLQLATIWWCAAVAFEHGATRLETKVFWAEMSWLGIVATPGYWALFIWNYTHGRERRAPRALHGALLAVALTAWLLALTNDSHHLIYAGVTAAGEGPYMTAKYLHGPLFFLLGTVFYVVLASAFAFNFYQIVNVNPVFRGHYVWFAVGCSLPLILNLVHFLDLLPGIHIDLTPFSFIFMTLIFHLQVSRRQLFDLLPVAHSLLLKAIPDPVLVLDSDRRIIECNPAALRLAGAKALVGLRLDAVAALHEGLKLPDDPGAAHYEAAIGSPARHFDVGQVPLPYTDRGIGRLILLRDITHRKEAEDRLQNALAELERHQRQLREESIRDALTGLHNRRFLDELGPIMLAEAKRSGAPLAALMLDIDHFKRLNDTHGHAAGDAMLRATGDYLRQQLRQSDAVFRMGGEEFLILLPHTAEQHAWSRLEAMRLGFMALAVEHGGLALRATVSAGFSMYPVDADDMTALLHQADLALYRAKAEGRNRVCRWEPELAAARDGAGGERA